MSNRWFRLGFGYAAYFAGIGIAYVTMQPFEAFAVVTVATGAGIIALEAR